MKNKLKSLLALGLMLPISLALVGCGHDHTYAEEWSMDATHHWHAATCEHTDEKSDYAEHDYTDANDITCNTCNYLRETAGYNLWDGTAVEVPSADQNLIITITSAEQLAGLAKKVNEGTTYEGYTIKLGVDINLQNKEWTPIGIGSYDNNDHVVNPGGYVFKGAFDGQNHTIYNLKITTFKGGTTKDNVAVGVGLFGNNLGDIKNVKVKGAEVKGNHWVAVIAGFNAGAVIDNCHVESATISCLYGDEDENGDKAGAIVGYAGSNYRYSSITNCSVKNTAINAVRDAGQVIGTMSGVTTQSGNTAENVTVTVNESAPADYARKGENINQEIVGKVA